MKLQEYIKTNKISIEKASAELGISQMTFYRYLGGKSFPNKTNREKILSWTGGKVSLADIYEGGG